MVKLKKSRFVATFLTKVDGFTKSKTNKMLLLIAATNRPWALDNAMIRGGRFDTHIYVSVPDSNARRFMVEKAFRDVPMNSNFDYAKLTEMLDGFGGGDIVAICEKIRLKAYKKSIRTGVEEKVSMEDCYDVLAKHHNVITREEIERFENFQNGDMD